MVSIVHSNGCGFHPSTQKRNDEQYPCFLRFIHLLFLHLLWKKNNMDAIHPMAMTLHMATPILLPSHKPPVL